MEMTKFDSNKDIMDLPKKIKEDLGAPYSLTGKYSLSRSLDEQGIDIEDLRRVYFPRNFVSFPLNYISLHFVSFQQD